MWDTLIGYGFLSAAFALGWVLRGMLCAKRGGCDAVAQAEIERLERMVR